MFVRAIVAACAPYADDPATIVRTVNAELVHQHGASAQFITMLCVVVHPDATMSWASAGHPPPVALADGEPIAPIRTGHPLGIAPEIAELEVARAALPAGGILLYTDGLSDARPPGRKFQPFGEGRIRALLRELDAPDARAGGRAARARRAGVRGRPACQTTCVSSRCARAFSEAGTTTEPRTPTPRRPRLRAPRPRATSAPPYAGTSRPRAARRSRSGRSTRRPRPRRCCPRGRRARARASRRRRR